MMNDRVPAFAETCKLHWNNLFEAVQELTDSKEPFHALLKTSPIADGIKKDYAVEENGAIIETDHHPLDNFFLYITAGERPFDFIGPDYLGSGKRIPDPDSNKFGYSRAVVKQLRQEIGLRLERLKSLKRDVYFTSKFLGYEKREATQEFIDALLDSDKKELGVVREKILE